MQVEIRHCVNHPDRTAIGVCMETKKPICGECSTRYNGVNYSREGLAILHERRRLEAAARNRGVGWFKLSLAGAFMSIIGFAVYAGLGKLLMLWFH